MIVIVLLALVFAGIRIGVAPTDATWFTFFKDFAHLYVGSLFGCSFFCWWVHYCCCYQVPAYVFRRGWVLFGIAVILSLTELACALLTRTGIHHV